MRPRWATRSGAFGVCLLAAVCASAPARALTKTQLQDLVVQCAVCHGADGVSRDDSIPNLDGQHDHYLYNQLVAFGAGRRTHKEMRVMSRQLTDDDMWAIAEYYAALRPR